MTLDRNPDVELKDPPAPENASFARRERQRSFAGAMILAALVLAAYWPALRGDFVWDDKLLVLKNPLVTGELNPTSIWFHTDFPLSLITLWIQWLLWGAHPIGFHIVNVLLHIATAL